MRLCGSKNVENGGRVFGVGTTWNPERNLYDFEGGVDEDDEEDDAQDPPIPFHTDLTVRDISEFLGDEFIVVEVVVGEIEAIVDAVLLPRLFWFWGRFFAFFGAFWTWLAHCDLAVAERAEVG